MTKIITDVKVGALMKELSIKDWSVDINHPETDQLSKGEVAVLFKNRLVGKYVKGKLFDEWYKFSKSNVIPVDVNFFDFFEESYMMERYHKECKEWVTYLSEQFGEELSDQESILSTLVKLEEFLVNDKDFVLSMGFDFVLLYSRIVTADVNGKELVSYILSGFDVVDDSEYTEAYIKDMNSLGYFPIRLTTAMK